MSTKKQKPETFRLTKKPRAADLARYLGVAQSTVSGYDPVKKELMIFGLWLKNSLGVRAREGVEIGKGN